MIERIDQLTADYLGDEASDADLRAYQAACRNYQAEHDCSERDAMDAIWGDGDFWPRVLTYAPDEAARADVTVV